MARRSTRHNRLKRKQMIEYCAYFASKTGSWLTLLTAFQTRENFAEADQDNDDVEASPP